MMHSTPAYAENTLPDRGMPLSFISPELARLAINDAVHNCKLHKLRAEINATKLTLSLHKGPVLTSWK